MDNSPPAPHDPTDLQSSLVNAIRLAYTENFLMRTREGSDPRYIVFLNKLREVYLSVCYEDVTTRMIHLDYGRTRTNAVNTGTLIDQACNLWREFWNATDERTRLLPSHIETNTCRHSRFILIITHRVRNHLLLVIILLLSVALQIVLVIVLIQKQILVMKMFDLSICWRV